LVHDYTALHIDAESTKSTYFGERIAHGSIALNLSVSLFFPTDRDWYTAGGRLASVRWENVRFSRPVRIGDTVHCRRTVVSIDETAPGAVFIHHVEVFNQLDLCVMSGYETLAEKGKIAGRPQIGAPRL
jgi:acyl dehydratase